MSDKTTVVNIDDIIDRSVDSGLDKVISQMTNLGDAASSTKEKIKGINEEAKKTEDTLSDMTSTMNVLFANRKGKNKGIFNSNDEKVAKKVIANVKDQVLANQQLAKIEKVISTGRVKYYTDEANALKHVEKSYKLYLEAKEKGLSDKVVNSRQNDVLRWGHSYLATLSDESKSQFNVLGNEFIAFWDKIQHKVYDKSGGLLSYSKENMKETFSFMKEMESNGFDLTVFKPEQVTVIEKTRKEVEKTTAAIEKMNDASKKMNDAKYTFYSDVEKRVSAFNKKWLKDGDTGTQDELISLYKDMYYYRSINKKAKEEVLDLLHSFEVDTLESPLNKENFKKKSEFTDGYIPESLKSLKKDTEELTVAIEEQTKAIEKRNDALKDGANAEKKDSQKKQTVLNIEEMQKQYLELFEIQRKINDFREKYPREDVEWYGGNPVDKNDFTRKGSIADILMQYFKPYEVKEILDSAKRNIEDLNIVLKQYESAYFTREFSESFNDDSFENRLAFLENIVAGNKEGKKNYKKLQDTYDYGYIVAELFDGTTKNLSYHNFDLGDTFHLYEKKFKGNIKNLKFVMETSVDDLHYSVESRLADIGDTVGYAFDKIQNDVQKKLLNLLEIDIKGNVFNQVDNNYEWVNPFNNAEGMDYYGLMDKAAEIWKQSKEFKEYYNKYISLQNDISEWWNQNIAKDTDGSLMGLSNTDNIEESIVQMKRYIDQLREIESDSTFYWMLSAENHNNIKQDKFAFDNLIKRTEELQKTKKNSATLPLTEETSGQYTFIEGVQEASFAVEKAQENIREELKKTNQVIEGQIDLFDYLEHLEKDRSSKLENLLSFESPIKNVGKSYYDGKNNYDWIGIYKSKEEAIAADLARNKTDLHSSLNLILSEDKESLSLLTEEANKLKTSLQQVQDMVNRISSNSSISYLDKNIGSESWYKVYAEVYKEIDDRLAKLNSQYDLTNEELEEYITLQVKAEKIMDAQIERYGGVQGSGAKNKHELKTWIEKSFAGDLGFNPKDIYNGLFGNITDALYDGNGISLFDSDGTKRNLRGIAAEILEYKSVISNISGDYGAYEDAKKLRTINTILGYINKNATEIQSTDFSSKIKETSELVDYYNQKLLEGKHTDYYSEELKKAKNNLQELIELQERLNSARGIKTTVDSSPAIYKEQSGQYAFIEGLDKTNRLIEEESGQMALFKVESENATDTAIEGQMHLNDYINKNIEDQITLNNLLEQQTKRDKILEKSKNNYIDVVDRPKSESEVLDSAYKMISDIEWYDANFNRKKLNNYADEIKQNKLLQEEYKEDAELLSVLKQEAYLLKAEFIAMYDVMMGYDGLEDDYGKIIHTGFSSMRKSNHELYDTLFNESRQLEQTSIAITTDIVKAEEKKHKYRLASLAEIPKLAKQEQQAYIETDKVIEQSAERVIEVNKQKNDHIAYLERERKEKEQLLGVEKELDKIRSKNPDDGKYLSQTGIVGSEDGWSVVKSLGYAQSQKFNYGYNEDTGLLEENPEKIVTNFEKLKNAIIATDKAVQRLKHDLKLTQEKNPGVDTSYLEKNISYVEAHLSALKKERDSYAKSSDYQETYKKHNEEIQEAHDKFANSLSQKDAISEYTQNQQRLIDIHKELNKLEDRRFNLNKGLISGSTKTPDADKKELLDIEKKSLDLTQEKINIEKSHGGNVLKEEIELQKKRIANEERLNELKKNASEKQQIDDAKEVNKLYDDLNAKLIRRYELEKRIRTNTSESYDNTKDLSALQKTNREIETLQQKRLTLGSKDNPARSKETDLKDLELQKKLLNEVVLAYGKANDELRNLEAQSNTPGSTKVYDPILESKREQVEKLRVEAEKAVDSMFKLYSKGDISNDDYVKLYNTYQSGTANSNAADQAKAQEQFNKNKQAALDEKEAVDLLKESLKDLSKIYGQLSSSAKNGFSSLSFQTNLQLLQDQLNKVSEYKDLAKKSGVSDDKISLLEKDYFKKSSSEIRKEGLSSISKFIADIDKYENKLRTSGELTEKTQTKFDGLRNALTYLFKDADFNTPEGLQDFIKAISVLGDNFQNTLNDVSKQNKFEFINNWITNFDKLSYKSDDVKSKLAELKSLVSNYESAKTSGNNQLIKEKEIELLTKAPGLINKIKQAASGKGNLVDNTLGNVNNIDDLNRALLEYAKNKGYVKALGTSLKSSNGEVTGTFIDQNGAVIKLTASMDQMVNGMREVTSTQRGAVGLFGSFKSALNSAAQSLAFYFSGTALIRRFFTEFRQGIDVLKKYDSALTNISYTMNMSKDSLQELGQSAIEMAKDLSMSLENTMSIYQIYANMQTTAEEIAETARPTAILSNLSGTNASTASDQIQGILNQFSMLKDADVDVAETSMHVVDVLDKISANVAIDYAKGIGIISDAVTATGQAAYDAGMSYEQLAAVSAKVAERTREDGSSIGNAIKTILTRISKVGKMPSYADEVDNETLSNASKSLNEIGIAVYNADGSFRNISVILSELSEKWDTLTDAQQSNIAYNVAATRQSNKFRAILEAWTSATELATEATNTLGNAEANQEKYLESYNGKIQQITTQMDAFWLSLFNSEAISDVLDFIIELTKVFNGLADAITPLGALLVSFSGLIGGLTLGKYIKGLGKDGIVQLIKNFGRTKKFVLYKYAEINKCSLGY